MEKNEYFQNIAVAARDERIRKSEWTDEEVKIYHEGEKNALREVLMMFNVTRPEQSRTYIENIWGVHELKNMIEIHIKSLNNKLILARRIYRSQVKTINKLSQTDIQKND